nr:hypothetical protein [Tanacetum cinerariifolium]
RDRHRLRHAGKRDQPCVRSVLYHQAHWPRDRARVIDDLRLHQAVTRPCVDRKSGRTRHHGATVPPPLPWQQARGRNRRP